MCQEDKGVSLSRRGLMAGAGALLAAGVARPTITDAADDKKTAPNAISPSEAFERLKAGNARYVSGEIKQKDCFARRSAQVEAQHPIAGILSCADSRVPPEIIFDQGAGDLFVSRDAGNVVSNYGLASFEFAVNNLGVPLILVLGHVGCGAVATALTASTGRRQLPGHLPELVKAIEPAIITAHGKHPGDFLAATIEENVRLGIKRLKTKSEIIGKAVNTGGLQIKGGVYDLETGAVTFI